MPAYRSPAEAEIRDAAIARLRECMSGCRIIHEINCASFGPNRIDLLAVTKDRIAAVEVKSERDELDRLPAQIGSMRGVAHFVIAALHEKFLTPWGSSYTDLPAFHEPEEARHAVVWAYPAKPRYGALGEWSLSAIWEKPKLLPPPSFIDLLWASELRAIVRKHGLHKGASRLDMPQMVDVLRWSLPGKILLAEVCATLRRRICIEADPAIEVAECHTIAEAARQPDLLIPETRAAPVQEGFDL
jgi:Holliday junction resolvase-like predicted endonuclease